MLGIGKSNSFFTLKEILIVVTILIIFGSAIIPTGFFVSQNKAITALETQGFSDIKITHRAVFFIYFRGGGKSDSVRFTAEATNPTGHRVTVYVFSGWLFKGATIRTQ